jgi:acyl dehydratase
LPASPTAAHVPFLQRFFEDYPVGETASFGDYAITEAQIVDFATRYDPQVFHLDPVAARDSAFGGLVASGWMTASVAMRMLVDHYISPISGMGSPGVDDLRWLKPVRPGDRLRMQVTVMAARRSQSKPDRGVVHFLQQVINQNDETVMTLKGWGMYRVRDTAAGVV